MYGDVYVNQGEEYTVYYTFININVCTDTFNENSIVCTVVCSGTCSGTCVPVVVLWY